MKDKWKRRYLSRRKYNKKTIKAVTDANTTPSVAQVKHIVNRALGQVIETKHADYLFEPVPASCLYHNTWFLMETDPLTLLQGSQDSEAVNPPNRIGDSIHSLGLKLNMMFYKFGDRCNQAIRILILKVKPDTPTPSNPCLHPQGVSNMVNPVDTENSRYISTVFDKVYTLNDNIAYPTGISFLRDTKFHFERYIKINKKVKYEDSVNSARNFTYNIWVCAYDTVNALTTDNIARFSYCRRHYFKDA